MIPRLAFLLGLPVMALLLGGCVFSGDSAGSVKVLATVLSSDLNDKGQPITVGRVFAPNVKRINAIVTLDGVKPNMEISGHWFQLNTKDVPADGKDAWTSRVKLGNSNIKDGRTSVTLFLPASQGNPIPEDAWLLRVYVDNTLIRTLAFIVTSNPAPQPFPAGQVAPPPPSGAPPPPPAGSPAPPAGAPTATPVVTTYTVVSGDTLQSIGQRFKPTSEDLTAYINRIVQTNSLAGPNATLNVGQQLRLPR